MLSISDVEFEKLIALAMDELPQKYIQGLNNVLIVFEDEPTEIQRQKAKLRHNQMLLGLYEGIPRTSRTNNYTMVLPDKITLFKMAILRNSPDAAALADNIKRTLWHEIAHHYGLDHNNIHQLEGDT